MRTTNALIVLGSVAVLGCVEKGRPHEASPSEAACSPAKLGLRDVKALVSWKSPAGCRVHGSLGPPPKVLHSEEQFHAHFSCPAGTSSGIDFAHDSLVFRDHMLSPAGVGSDLYDDGRTVTIVSRFRSPCPDDPHPMPVPFTLTFLLPAGGERKFAEMACNVESRCP